MAILETAAIWRPAVLVLAGIAGGLPPAVTRGDVLISKAIWGYEYGAIAETFQPRLDWIFQANPELVQAASTYRGQWQANIDAEKPDPAVAPRHLAGVTGSGSKVIENLDSAYVAAVLARYPEIASVEMEAAGAFAAARLLSESPQAPRVVMFRGISDIPNPRSGTLGDKKDRELWKRYASDSVAAFTVAFLRDALPAHPVIPDAETDILLVTYSDEVYQTLLLETGASVSEGQDSIALTRFVRDSGNADLRVVIHRLTERVELGEFNNSLMRFNPAAVLLVDTALGVGETNIGDVVLARIVWPFNQSGGAIQAHFAEARRGSPSLVVAGQAIEAQWEAESLQGSRLKSGTIAGGASIPHWNDNDIVAAISSLNPRTAMIDDDSALIAGSLFQRVGAPHFLSIQAAENIASKSESDTVIAGKNAARAALMLMRQRWPYAAVNSD